MYQEIVLAKLPDPLLLADGTRAEGLSGWEAVKAAKLSAHVDLVYGGMPPAPEDFSIQPLHTPGPGRMNSYQLQVRTPHGALSFVMQLTRPAQEGRCPVVLTGDGCYRNMSDEVVAEINRRGMIAATFNRTVLAADIKGVGRDYGLYPLYPSLPFGALSAWAWGYSRCVDALATLDFVDAGQIGISGHSRGGKTTLLAGATDERIAVVHANNSGAGGTGSWRYQMKSTDPNASPHDRSEVLSDLIRNLPFWFGPELPAYVGREEELPYDQFLLEAAVAPRKMLDTQGLADIWANPAGAMQTHLAAREIFSLYGAPQNIRILYREGGHGHGLVDYCALLDFMQDRPADATQWQNPYAGMKKAFDW